MKDGAKMSKKELKKAEGKVEVNQTKKAVLFKELSDAEAKFQEDKELREYLPSMKEHEIEALDAAIVRDGYIKDSLVVWNGRLLDGYARLDIARKYKLSYKVVELQVETKEEALVWLVEHHIARRHLSKYSIVDMYLGLEKMYKAIAKSHQGRKDSNFSPIDTLKKIGEHCDCGKTLVHMVKTIRDSKKLKLIEECRSGKKSIRRGYYTIVESPSNKNPNEEPVTFKNPKSGDFIDRIIKGDVLKKMKELNEVLAAGITLILTSIPFNADLDYGNGCNDKKDYKKEYLPWLGECIKEFVKALRPGGRLIIECDSIRDEECKNGETYRRNIFADLCRVVEEVAPELDLLGDIVWYKNNPKHYLQTGSYCSCRSPRLARNHSYILIWSKGKEHTLPHINVSKSDIEENDWNKMVNSVYADIAADKNGKKLGHPATWPQSLCDRLIRLFSYPDKKNIVLDPFNGVGNTVIAAYKAGRSYIGIEQNPKHCLKAQELLDEAKAELEKKNNAKVHENKYAEVA
ncbi:MAG: Modification methylase MboII [bacterium ADurb.Bin157]|nr:MAG: Modification methylase MboII [bacterium ADurb.Bin157]